MAGRYCELYLLCNGAAACYRPSDQLNNWLMADDGAPRAAKRARSAPAAGEGLSMVARQAAENAKLGRTGGIYVPPFKLAALRLSLIHI